MRAPARRERMFPRVDDVTRAEIPVMTCVGEKREDGNVTVKYDGVLIGGGRTLARLRKQMSCRCVAQETVATLDAKADAQGHLEFVPVKLFVQDGGYKFATAMSENFCNVRQSDRKTLAQWRDGIAVGYFVAPMIRRWSTAAE